MAVFANRKSPVIAVIFGGLLVLASCTPTKKTESVPATQPQATTRDSGSSASTVMLVPGEAGGIFQETFTASATISAIDASTRTVTLTSDDGNKVSFKAPPEIRNFDQMEVGDKVDAKVVERLAIFVRSGTEDPTVTHAASLITAPKGATPGALVAETYEIKATVTAIDPDLRTAVLQFPGGKTQTISVRKDVDLSRYNVGDTVVIRVKASLLLVVKKS